MLLARLTDHVKRRVLLTGTVMPHSPLDVFGQWRFLDPYAFGYKNRDGTIKQATYTAFRTRFAVYGGYMGYQVLGWQNLEDMQAIMARNAVVARKADALDLPPTTDVEVPVHLDPAEAKAYSEMKQQLATLLAPGVTATVPNRLTQMLRLRQITAGHVPDDNDVLQVIGRSKVDVIKSLVEDTLAGETRIVVFAFFTQEIRMLEAALRVKGTEVEVIQGGTPTQERAAIRKRFGSNDPARIVLVAQVKTLSLAVNELVTANHAIFASLSQQRDDMEQAKARLDRQGQTKPVTFWYALAPGTVDEVIMRSHRDRTSLETAMLRHIREGDEQA
jgi:SNF2 family DNA or RNA helicase